MNKAVADLATIKKRMDRKKNKILQPAKSQAARKRRGLLRDG